MSYLTYSLLSVSYVWTTVSASVIVVFSFIRVYVSSRLVCILSDATLGVVYSTTLAICAKALNDVNDVLNPLHLASS